MTMDATYVIGIDGGATKTELALCRTDGTLQRTLRAESCNPHDVGFAQCERVLRDGVSTLLGPIPQEAVAACFAGVSGVETDGYSVLVVRSLREAFPAIGQIVCENDALNPLYGGLGERDGCAVISGTGMICYARAGGVLYRTGGWGHLFDNAGSGYDLGRDALTAVYRAHDGIGPQTALTALTEELLGESAEDALGRFYRGKRAHVAALAPAVFSGVRMGDAVSLAILERNMAGLAEHINHAATHFTVPFATVITGGVFQNKEAIVALSRHVTAATRVTVYDKPPMFGAARRALILAGCGEIEIDEAAVV